MAADDSHPWDLRHQDPDKDDDWLALYLAELGDWRRQRHLNRLAERKADREAARRKAKGLSASPTDYPWLKPDWVDPPVMPLWLRNRR